MTTLVQGEVLFDPFQSDGICPGPVSFGGRIGGSPFNRAAWIARSTAEPAPRPYHARDMHP